MPDRREDWGTQSTCYAARVSIRSDTKGHFLTIICQALRPTRASLTEAVFCWKNAQLLTLDASDSHIFD